MKVHETAFLTCAYRATEPALSHDIYAYLYGNELTDKWVKAVTEEVSSWEPFLHCLRNRYFLDTMTAFFEEHPDGVLVNWGAGFSMYPFLIGGHIRCLDIDQADIISHKSELLEQWMSEGKVPTRHMDYLVADFTRSQHADLISQVTRWIDGKPSFFVLEGVLYFLKPEVTDRLFETFKSIQTAGDLLGCVSFLPESLDTEVQIKLDTFFNRNNVVQGPFSHHPLSTESYETRSGYTLIDHQDYCSLSARYSPERAIADWRTILNENMYLLRRC